MSFIAAAVVASAGIGYLASQNAASTQASGQQQAAATQQGMFNTINQQNQPFIQAGYGATSNLQQLLGLTGTPGQNVGNTGLTQGYLTQTFNPTQAQLNNYPGYQFALQTGGQAIRNADTPGVGALSGPALKDLMNFNTGTASQYYNQYFNQFQQQQNNIFNRLSNVAGIGQNAATNVGNAGTTLGTGIAGAQAGAAASLAAGQYGGASSIANSLVPAMYLSGLSTASNPAVNPAAGGFNGITAPAGALNPFGTGGS